ncbi:hypothetical protein ABB37_01191 [Leptomonas pyrrhocoris]|uniref:Uncharacterized protein n=1 Tax=Leptomonas pyrrhocoris TaxID=157538 RepID=A0A0M9G8A4_LEPPY|nr:hypothetical protein ABB37_01191 [Leptomonas pyrrhocoris]KPA84683.1 hypothetical protein ABB37_01191 [Leptomonas pyrrhocoris]|eukprot:XP_015663122.1 hypothetical protein ABB37_01191 [Leptomonas pyrrhocoris]
MPFFGVDDILFLLASTTALLWAKRADIVEGGVYATVHLITSDAKEAARRASRAADAHGGTPTLLLKGFDLQAEERRLLSLQDCSGASPRGFGPSSTSRSSPPTYRDRPRVEELAHPGDGEDESMLIKESVHAQFRETPLVYQVPQVPHRHYNPRKRQRHVSWLATASEEDVKECIARYTVPEVQTLFSKMEREGLWESVIHVSYGIEQAQEELRYLNQHNIECAIRTLLNTAHSDAALVYYFRFGEDVLLSDEILVALFHTCRHDEQLSLELCQVMEPFKSRWTPTVYACCLTTTARYDYTKAIELYDAYMAVQRSRQHGAQGAFHRVLAASSLLRETGMVTPETPSRLHYLYHIIIPLVVAHDSASAEKYVDDMFENDAESAPDVFLKCLGFAQGRELVRTHLKELQASSKNGSTNLALPKSDEVGDVAVYLYRLRPSAMNMNTLLKLLTEYSLTPTAATVTNEQPKPTLLSTDRLTNSLQSLPFPAKTRVRSCPSMDALCNGTSTELGQLLQKVPLQTEWDASVLARTITENHASWLLAVQFLSIMLRRKCFSVVPGIATHVARQGQWSTAAKSMAIYLSNQRAAMTTAEATLCVEANIHAGQWASALFWVERAHTAGLALAPSTYDLVLAASRHCKFEAAERVLVTMHDVGASCSERGVRDFIETAAHQGMVSKAFHVLQQHSSIQWTP